jgi:hypothetical protein
VRSGGETEVGLSQERQAVPLLDAVEFRPEPGHSRHHGTDLAARQPWQLRLLGPAGLEGKPGHAGSELSRAQVVPDAAAQALGGQQVELGVDPRQHPAVGRDGVRVGVAELLEDRANPVECPGDNVCSPGHLAVERFRLAVEPEVFLGLPGMCLLVGAAVARVLTQPASQVGDGGLGLVEFGPILPGSLAKLPGTGAGELVAHRGGQVLAMLRRARIEPARNRDALDRHNRIRAIGRREAPDLPVLGQQDQERRGGIGGRL